MENKNSQKKIAPVIIVIAVLLVACLAGALAAALPHLKRTAAQTESTQTESVQTESVQSTAATDDSAYSVTAEEWGSRIDYNGVRYTKNNDLKLMLFLGIDNAEATEANENVLNHGRSDTIILFILNTKTQTIEMLQIPRDTIVPVTIYDKNGAKVGTDNMQITLQYAYGDSPSRCCTLTEHRVYELIHGIDIDGYLSLTMDGMPEIVDQLGGIPLTFDQDYTYIDEAFQAGATLTLNGSQVNEFIRYRDTNEYGSDNDRMARTAWFMKQFFAYIRNSGISASKLLNLADNYIETNLDAETLNSFSKYSLSDTSYKIPGTNSTGTAHDEYYVDQDALNELLLQLFYQAS